MFLRRLKVCHFRNYEDAQLEFDPSLNVFHGDNAQGKTNLLEAIYLLILGRSFRTHHLQEMTRRDSEGFHVEAHFLKNGVEQKIRMTCRGKERKIVYNNTPCPSAASLLGLLTGVIITPGDELIKGPPQARRNFLDILIAQADPLYIHHLTRYTRAMQQRNAQLRSYRQNGLAGIELWEQEMAHAAVYIAEERRKIVWQLGEIIQGLFSSLSGDRRAFQLSFKASQPQSEESLLQKYVSLRPREMLLGITLAGPHRDELMISLDGQEVRLFGSEGQQRICVMALRLAGWNLLKNILSEPPLTLIDDIGMSLDATRYAYLMKHLENLGQVFMTNTQPVQNPTARQFLIQQGTVVI